jgi:hypothetical protein
MSARAGRASWIPFVFAFCLPLVAFASLAEEASEGEQLAWDASIEKLLDARSAAASAASTAELAALVVLLAALPLAFAANRRRRTLFWVLAIVGTLALGVLCDELVKQSFGSMSASVSMAAMATVPVLAGTGRPRVFLTVAGLLLVLAEGAAVIHLGQGVPSEVAASWCISVAWVAGLSLVYPLPAPAARRNVRAFVRGLLRRQPVDDLLDWVRFRVDTFPRSVALLKPLRLPELQSATYHELPWVGVRAGRRAESSKSRWKQIARFVESLDVRSALDIGANSGWFSFKLAELGIPTIAVERSPRGTRIGLYVRKRSGLEDVSFLVSDVNVSSVERLPEADCVLLLSVWHHFVREDGIDSASAILAELWTKTGSVLFFETGESEMPDSWQLPDMRPDARTWLTRYLTNVCSGSIVVHLGLHDALSPNNEPCTRNLFAVVRVAGGSRRHRLRAGVSAE